MTLFYKGNQSKFKDQKTGKKLWHIKLKKVGGTVGLRELARMIAEKSSLTEGDVFNVVTNLPNVMRVFLLNSRTVRLDGLGTFTLAISSRGKGVEKMEDINPGQVVSLKCRFTPEYSRQFGGGMTRALYEGVTFQKWDDKLKEDERNKEESVEEHTEREEHEKETETPSTSGDGII